MKKIIGYILMTIPVFILLACIFYCIYKMHNLVTAIVVFFIIIIFVTLIIVGGKLITDDEQT